MRSAQERYWAEAAKRRQTALRYHQKGWTMQEIGEKMGVTRQRVSQWIKKEKSRGAA